jgi:serine phosphatase RsbU (regulator of sigma subunit)/catechol 2,3-dioxygenase-like lactoylglutathione lyase family enzyme
MDFGLIITPMGSSLSRLWADRPTLRLDRREPYLRIQHVTIFVRDLDRSLRFYLDQLGFSLVADYRYGSGERWVAVAPADGSAILALVTPKPDSEEYNLIGRSRQIVFVTEDVPAKFHEWCNREVQFRHPPRTPDWGGTFTSFEDVDGNSFVLVGFDEVSREIEAQRTAIGEKLEFERRAAQELEIAKQVQARLFPQTLPSVRTLDYAGICIQARQVGGDYYDFLNLGEDRLALVIGDIAGKGIAAALLMANLQANLRSQCAIAPDQPQRVLKSVNQLFCENTTDSAYATLFFAEYDGQMQRLRYVNCGHLSALLLRHDDTLERLDSTCTVLGLFKEWNCSTGERSLSSGDIFALYTDGITEALNDAGDDFGVHRLIESLRRHREQAAPVLVAAIVDDVKKFSPHEQSDDMTLIVAKGR